MPLFEYLCQDCGQKSEILVSTPVGQLECQACGSANLKKLLSAHASPSVGSKDRLPGPGDTGCCGSRPGQAAGCAGPGSCCGKH